MTQTLFALTLRLAFRIAIVWAGGFILAVAAYAFLPNQAGLTFTGNRQTYLISYSKMGFWVCLLAALAVSGLVVIRAMLIEFGVRPPG